MLTVRRMLISAGVALLVGVGGPILDVVAKCERSRARVAAACPTPESERLGSCPPVSEACVWGKALLPVSIGVGLLLLGVPAGLLAYWWAGRWGPRPAA